MGGLVDDPHSATPQLLFHAEPGDGVADPRQTNRGASSLPGGHCQGLLAGSRGHVPGRQDRWLVHQRGVLGRFIGRCAGIGRVLRSLADGLVGNRQDLAAGDHQCRKSLGILGRRRLISGRQPAGVFLFQQTDQDFALAEVGELLEQVFDQGWPIGIGGCVGFPGEFELNVDQFFECRQELWRSDFRQALGQRQGRPGDPGRLETMPPGFVNAGFVGLVLVVHDVADGVIWQFHHYPVEFTTLNRFGVVVIEQLPLGGDWFE